MSAAGAVRSLLRDAARLDRTQSDPAVALRNAIGIAVPLAIGILTGGAARGLPSTIGALQTAFADRPGPYRLRILRMLGTAFAAGTTSALAVLASRSDVGSALLLLVLAFGAGLLLTAGPAATQVGVAGVGAALVLGHIPQPPSDALEIGLLVLAGGAFQTLLAVAGWPLGRHRPERVALATLYRALADIARRQPGTGVGPAAGDLLTTVRQTFYGLGHDHGRSVEAYRVLLDEAERIRRELFVVTSSAERLADEGNPILAGLVRAAESAAADVMDEIADALAGARALSADVLTGARAVIRRTIERLTSDPRAPGELTRRATAARLRTLSGQLRAAVETAVAGASEGRASEEDAAPTRLRAPFATMRANLTPNSAVLRHAVRLAILVAGSDLITRLAGFTHGYWVALTILVVLRPDFGTTLQRSVLRAIGTVIGLLLATELIHWVPGGQWWSVGLIFIFAFGMRFAGPGNIALSAVSLSALVVILLSIDGSPAHTTLVARSVATLVGGALAVLATLALPLWERSYVPTRLAELLDSYAAYLAAVVDPRADRAARDRARAVSRLARSNAQVSVDRARTEPVGGQAQVELGEAVLAHSHRLVHGIMALDAVRDQVRATESTAELRTFLDAAQRRLRGLGDALRSGVSPRTADRLRPLQEELYRILVADPDRAGGTAAAASIADATDRITNSLDTLASELRRQRALPSSSAA